jgi:hypothetical protein
MEMDGRSSDGGETQGRRLGVAARWAGVAADGGRVTRRGLRADRGHSVGPQPRSVCVQPRVMSPRVPGRASQTYEPRLISEPRSRAS